MSTSEADHTPCALPNPSSTASFWHTEPSPLLLGHRSTRNLPEHVNVVVIGSGITGASVAHHLLENSSATEHKLDVLMLEAREACWGATGRNGGHCQPLLYEHPHDPSIGHFEIANFAAIESLCSTRHIDCEFYRQHGVRAIYTSVDLALARQSITTLRQTDAALASRVRLVTDVTELQKLRLPTAKGAVVTDIAARMWPYKFVARILEDLLTSTTLAGSFNLQTHTPVLSIQSEKTGHVTQWTVNTPRGTVTADRLVLATNAYTSYLVHSLADLIVPCRGQMSALVPPATASGDNRLQTSFGFVGDGQDDYLVQRPSDRGEHLMFGGGRSAGPSLGVTDDSVIDKAAATYLRTALNTMLGLGGKSELNAVLEWTGIMGFSRDDHPWVGPVPGSRGLFISAGYTGHGMPNAWLCGKAAATMVIKAAALGSEEMAVREAVEKVGLPQSYVLNELRLIEARKLDSVRMQDEKTMFKAEKMS